ncbi:hypothetical protein N7535_004371 [Penicillium sp. DV-2018c]|nr:hypothetical protein N7535_004371 [Penicillium sp. DV-2018c]
MILQHQPDSKEAFEAWAEPLNDVESRAITGATVEILGQFLYNCGKKQQGNDMIAAMKYFTKDESVPITVYGYVYTSTLKMIRDLYIEIWGIESYEIGGMSDVEVHDTDKGAVKKFVSSMGSRCNPYEGQTGYYFAGWVKINGLTGKAVDIAVYSDHDTRNIHLQLHPPGGPISISFDSAGKYCKTTIPSLLASGKYSAP